MNSNGDHQLKIYDITHRLTGEKSCQAATTAYDACKQTGWVVSDCYVNEQTPRVKPVSGHKPRVLFKVPCLTCPFQYAECRKPDSEACPVQPTAPEFEEWLKQAAQAHLCHHVGANLTKLDYDFRQKWVTLSDAIKELELNSAVG